jgi:hypothetical protein
MSTEKEVLQLFAKYCEMLQLQLADTRMRLKAMEYALESNAELHQAYSKGLAKESYEKDTPGLPRQLSAVQQAIANLRS